MYIVSEHTHRYLVKKCFVREKVCLLALTFILIEKVNEALHITVVEQSTERVNCAGIQFADALLTVRRTENSFKTLIKI